MTPSKGSNIKPSILIGNGIPEFKKICPNDINTEIPNLLKELEADFLALENSLDRQLKNNKTITPLL